MGCGASVRRTGELQVLTDPVEASGILVLSASGLRDADGPLSGQSDPYVKCRVGVLGSSWEKKSASDERRSVTVSDDADPVWQLAFSTSLGAGDELQLKVYDKDHLYSDDLLGEARIPFSDLSQHLDELRDYPLQGTTPGASVKVMMGARVHAALMEELEKALAASAGQSSWFAPVRAVVNRLGQYFANNSARPYYFATLVSMGIAWAAKITTGRDPSSEWFLEHSRDPQTQEDTYRWSGPQLENSLTLSGSADVAERLARLPGELGTNNSNGKCLKGNYLGVQTLNSSAWPEVHYHAIGLGAPQEAHAFQRPILTKLCGPAGRWSSEWLRAEAQKFFLGRTSIRINEDLRVWTTRVLHQVFLGLELTEAEGAEYMALQKRILIFGGAPEEALKIPGVTTVLKVDETLAEKATWLARYRDCLRVHLPEETAGMSETDLTVLASNVMDALLFAGGQSVPTVLQYALALPYSEWGQENLPEDFCLCRSDQLSVYLWEVIRVFAPVSFFVYTERSFGNTPEQNVFLNIQMAQRDPRVWGPDAGKFNLRPVADYHKNSVGFCEGALDNGNLSGPNSRMCPAKDLAFAMSYAFMREFAISVARVAPERAHDMQTKVWVAKDAEGVNDLAPKDLELTMYGTTSFILSRNPSAEEGMPTLAERSGQELLDKLTPEELQIAEEHVRRHNKFDTVNLHTNLLIRGVQLLPSIPSADSPTFVEAPVDMPISEDIVWHGPFEGLRMITQDEQKNLINHEFGVFVQRLVWGSLAAETKLDLAEKADDLVYFDDLEEAVMSMDVTFGKVLPAQYNRWPGMSSDTSLASLCLSGVGAWYLQRVTAAEAVGHAVPDGAAMECNLEYMSKYGTRDPWQKYGHTVYLSPCQEGALIAVVVGIWSCPDGRLVLPGDEMWEVTKAGFRSSLCTSVTLKDHLATVHWIVANGLMDSARSTLTADHPLRRLVRQFYHRTADINHRSKELLLPEDRLGFRMFGFDGQGWGDYFKDIFSEWSWSPFPELMKGRGFSESFLKSWPLAQDGELVWNTFHKYVSDYLGIFYSSEESVAQDIQVVDFWAFFDVHIKWKLPALTLASLTALVTDLMFMVTAGHELLGSIVEYLTTPGGLMPKLVAGKSEPDVQTFAQALIVISLTGFRMPPLMGDWTHIFQVDSWDPTSRQRALDLARKLQADLAAASDEISDCNIQRERRGEHKFVAFDPRILETSVSI
mmetsp:Transcript_11483/g.40878  ORF Transcript_11483/g.40878 Transcript_11483/m.40878 type:complete len:1212 (-) Transcript_11483:137-3772(-)